MKPLAKENENERKNERNDMKTISNGSSQGPEVSGAGALVLIRHVPTR